MSRKRGFKTVLGAVIIMIVILVALTYVALKYLVPAYEIDQNKIYYVAIRIFPLLIGITLITIATMLSSNKDENEEDEADMLPPNSYDSSLFDKPTDDPEDIKKPEEKTENTTTEEVPFVSVFEEEKPVEAKDNEKENLNDSLNRIETRLEKLSTAIATLTKQQTPTAKESVAPVTSATPVSVDETAQMLYRDYTGSDAQKKVMAEFDSAVENGYDLTLALVDLPISQVSLSLGAIGDTLEVSGKTLVIIPFEDENEVKAELDKLEAHYEMRSLKAENSISYEEFAGNLVE